MRARGWIAAKIKGYRVWGVGYGVRMFKFGTIFEVGAFRFGTGGCPRCNRPLHLHKGRHISTAPTHWTWIKLCILCNVGTIIFTIIK
jgi:hypothetical protein